MKEAMTKYILKFLAVLIAVGCFSIPCIADSYDPLKRISGIVDSEDFLMSESFDYDLNGNTTAIVRGGNGNDTMDNITLEYDGNQIVSVSDNPTFDYELGKIPQLVAGNYPNAMGYDENGRPKYDRSRNVEQIQYNHLDLPTYVRFGKNADNLNDGVYYTYRADGVKMSESSSQRYIKMITTIDKNGNSVTKPRVESNNISRRYYGNVVKTNGALRFYNEMGYVDYDAKSDSAIYYYYERDYLGSVRAIVDKNGTMMQAMDYYSTGIPHSKLLAQPVDNRMHTGKEFQNLNGLGWYDNSARQMDAILGRFTTPDPLAEKYYGFSPYAHCANNPLRYTDPDGRMISMPKGASTKNIYIVLGTMQKLTSDKLVYSTQKDGSIRIKVASLGDGSKPAGTSLIRGLNSSDKMVTIDVKDSQGNFSGSAGNRAKPVNYADASNGKGSNALVSFDPDSNPKIPTIDTKTGNVSYQSRSNQIGLGHELIHAKHYIDGDRTPSTQTTINPSGNIEVSKNNIEENRTVGVSGTKDGDVNENQLRKEQSENPRAYY